MGTFVARKTLEKLIPVIRMANRKLKKRVRNKPLNTTQQRNAENAMETFDDLMADRNSGLPGASKPSALISNKRMNNAIQRIAEGKTQTQTDSVYALLQAAGVGFLAGVDTASRSNTNTTKNKTKKVQTSKLSKIPSKTPLPPKPKSNSGTQRSRRFSRSYFKNSPL